MNVSAKVALFALMTFSASRRCDGCLDVLLKSFFQVFNPNVEAGPGRLISQHRYADGIMPDYPVAHNSHSRCSRRTGPRPQTPAAAVDDGQDAPTADYVDGESGSAGGAIRSPGYVTGERPLTDFIISLLETFQLTSRATLKRSAKTNSGRPLPAGVAQPESAASAGPLRLQQQERLAHSTSLPARATQRTTTEKLGRSRPPRSFIYPNPNGRHTLFVL